MDINFFDPKYLTEAARDDSSFGFVRSVRLPLGNLVSLNSMKCR